MTTNTILDLSHGDLFRLLIARRGAGPSDLSNGKTRRFISLRPSVIGEEVRAVAFEDEEGKRHEEPIGTRVAVTIVVRENEIRPFKDRKGRALKSAAELADGMIWPFANSAECRSKALEVLAMEETVDLRARHFETVAEGYRAALKRSWGVEFDDARSRHKTRNCLAVAEMVRDALAALER